MKSSALTLLVFLIISSAGSAQARSIHRSEQVHFSAEEAGVRHPVAIPEDVMAILRRDGLVQSVLENENKKPESLPASWFSASAIHLSSAGKTDLIVVGEPPIVGGNVTLFWVFCATDHGHELVLMAPAHDLIVKNTRWNRHRDIELISMSAVQISSVRCRFDGKQYKAYRRKSKPID